MTTIHMSQLGRNWAPAPRMKSCPRPHSPSKSKRTTRSREVWFDKVVINATRLIRLHKTRHAVSTQLKACHQGQSDVVLNRHR
jgi:hypothetical protein